MKKFLKIVMGIFGAILLVLFGFYLFISIRGIPTYDTETVVFEVNSTPEKVAQGEKLVNMLCFHCHYSDETGKLSGKRILDLPEEFGIAYSRNITQHPENGIGNWTNGEIAYLIRTGVKNDGQFIPPYMPKLPRIADEDLEAIIAFLRSDNELVQPSEVEQPASEPSFLTKLLSNFVFKPLPYSEEPIEKPSINNKVAYGKYVVNDQLDCYGCHSADFKTINLMDPNKSEGYLGGGNPMPNLEGEIVHTANITMDKETGIGTWDEEDLITALKYGKRPDGTSLRYPMVPFPYLTDEEIKAVYAYLQTVPKIKNEVPRSNDALAGSK